MMVTRINDRKVAHLSCGAECMVALDTEGIVWAWGRNDAGQVRMRTALSADDHYSAHVWRLLK